MQTYREWSPTGFDRRGAFLDDRQDWLVVPVIRTRDSGHIDASNFETACSLVSDASVLDDELSFETHRFAHWGPGWFEILIVRPGSKAAAEAEDIEARLEDYPLLDEDDLSEREFEAASEYWERESVAERVRIIQEHGRGVSIFAARRDEIPQDDCGAIFDYCRGE